MTKYERYVVEVLYDEYVNGIDKVKDNAWKQLQAFNPYVKEVYFTKGVN